MIYAIVVLVSFVAVVNAGCDNACSGHGTCTSNGICDCYDNWGLGLGHLSGDCSQRTCPYEIAFVDSPYLASTYRKGYSHGEQKTGSVAADDDAVEVGNFNPFRNAGSNVAGSGGYDSTAKSTNGNGGEPYTDVKRHRYAECSGRGLCNRDNGECECFPGYEGKGCQRTTCPNDCSGHGRCAYIERMPYETTAMAAAVTTGDWSFLSQDAHTFEYFGWDRHKTRGCICDPEYGDLDCSKRMCPFGTDIMDQRNNLRTNGHYEVQSIWLQAYGADAVNGGDVNDATNFKGRTFALTFKSKLNESFTTRPIVMDAGTSTQAAAGLHDMVLDIEQALEELPNRVIDDVKVNVALFKKAVSATATDAAITDAIKINITFSGEHVQGPQNLLTVRSYLCGDGCTPRLTGLNLEPNKQFVSVGFVNRFGHYVQDVGIAPSLLANKGAVNQPGGTIANPYPGLGGDNVGGNSNVGDTTAVLAGDANTLFGRNVGMAMSDYNSYECGRRGKCDYTTGVCGCFAGYTGISCGTITALV